MLNSNFNPSNSGVSISFSQIYTLSMTVIVIACMFSQPIYSRELNNTSSATEKLYHLFDQEWEYQLKTFPENATYQGDPHYNDRLTDWSLSAIKERQRHQKTVVEQIERINRAQLSTQL